MINLRLSINFDILYTIENFKAVNMRNFEVSTDSTCDLYANEYVELDVYHSSLTYTIEDKAGNLTEHLDNFTEQSQYIDFYARLRNGDISKTAILNVQAHVDMFMEMAKRGVKNALHISQSYGLSPTLDNANKAIEIVKESYPDINYKAIESRTTTIGEGIVVKTACELRDEGYSLDDAIDYLEDYKIKIQHFVVVNDLMYLKRGGRISGTKAAMGTMLALKPVIEFSKEGKLEIVRKEMGIKKALRSIVAEFKNYTQHERFKIVIVHTDNLPLATELQTMIKNAYGIEPEIRIMGPIIGSHVGPGAVAYGFVSNEERPV